MHALSAILLATIPFGTLVGAHQRSRSRYRHAPRSSQPAGIPNKTYVLDDFYQAQDFFSNWTFFTGQDPTDGYVNYQSMSAAVAQGLAYVDECDNSTVLAVDSTSNVPAGGNRNSVRITSNKSYNGGLFILDAAAMPVGCGTWPSWWTVGEQWPEDGEIDIVEGVNNQANNQMTLHSGTNASCTISTSNSSLSMFSGHVLNPECYSTATADSGCSISDPDPSSFGPGFNVAQGGVFALLWDASFGMAMWHFARANIPADITGKTPNPSRWTTPAAYWSASSCDISANFQSQTMVIDTTICGNWANSAYASSGCPGTCSAMVANSSNFVDAKWVINYIGVYQ